MITSVKKLILCVAALNLCACHDDNSPAPQDVEQIVVDAGTARSIWAKAVGDIDGDGIKDLIIGGHEPERRTMLDRVFNKLGSKRLAAQSGSLIVYTGPDWQPQPISTDWAIRTDLAIADIDADGDSDVLALTDSGLVFFRNPDWRATIIPTDFATKFHDIEIADMDDDGDIDIVLRSQSLFGYDNGNAVVILWRDGEDWIEQTLPVAHGEGLAVRDLNADGLADIVVNDVWLQNSGSDTPEWQRRDYTQTYDWSHVYLDIYDINLDGRPDILASPAEPLGERYRISWFEAPVDVDGVWREHVVKDDAEAVHHFVGAGDFDGNGLPDVFSAEMSQSDGADDVSVFLQCGELDEWRQLILSEKGSHSMKVADLDGDGRDEVVGANWQLDGNPSAYPISFWRYDSNENCGWRRHVVGENVNKKHLFVVADDFNGDGLIDVSAGPAWFENPGSLAAPWQRHIFGGGFTNTVLAADIDRDGDVDLLGSALDALQHEPSFAERLRVKLTGAAYPGSSSGNTFYWAENLGGAMFDIHKVAELQGDYLQGAALYESIERRSILLSWHTPGVGLDQLYIDPQSTRELWVAEKWSDYSQDEALSVFDMNGDGILDVVTGTSWLSGNGGRSRMVHELPTTIEKPDRHILADFDGDQRIDLVIGEEAVGVAGRLMLISDVAGAVHPVSLIDRPVGPMSLGKGDLNLNGRLDLVVGEHDIATPDRARLMSYELSESSLWLRQTLSTGVEHHNGAVVVDIDNDGDQDIVSIGWSHGQVLVYENPAL